MFYADYFIKTMERLKRNVGQAKNFKKSDYYAELKKADKSSVWTFADLEKYNKMFKKYYAIKDEEYIMNNFYKADFVENLTRVNNICQLAEEYMEEAYDEDSASARA